MSAPVRMILGLIKGALIAGSIGLGLSFVFSGNGWLATLIAMLLGGALVGIVCGVPFWKIDQWPTTLVKALFGVGVGALVNFLLDSFALFQLPHFVNAADQSREFFGNHWIGVAAFGGLWGLIVDLDAGFDDNKADANGNKKK
jgi:hypothetical protein